MRIYGSSANKAAFKKYCLDALSKANIDHEKAFKHTEIYFRNAIICEEKQKDLNRIIDFEIDKCRDVYGEKGVQRHVRICLIKELAKILANMYMERKIIRWESLQNLLGHKLDLNHYKIDKTNTIYKPGEEVFSDLFEASVYGYKRLRVTLCKDTVYPNELLLCRDKKIRLLYLDIDHIVWRQWFCELWEERDH